MKLLLIGHTSLIGSAILRHCLSIPAITSLVILSRHPLGTASGLPDDRIKAIKVIVVDSFTLFDGDVLQELEGAAGCLWQIFPPALSTQTLS